jgi:hypothetical protein
MISRHSLIQANCRHVVAIVNRLLTRPTNLMTHCLGHLKIAPVAIARMAIAHVGIAFAAGQWGALRSSLKFPK